MKGLQKINRVIQSKRYKEMEAEKRKLIIVDGYGDSKVALNNCVAYCEYHKYYLSVKQLKLKQCLQKKCRHCVKMNHDFWFIKEEKKREKSNG